jgi:type II secretory pathway pseudopilin PulG
MTLWSRVFIGLRHEEAGLMKFQRGITVVELVVLFSIIVLLLLIGVPKIMDGFIKSKMRDNGVNTLNVFEAKELEYFAKNNRLGPLDSLIFTIQTDSSEYFSFKCEGMGRYTAVAKKSIGKFKKGSWMSTSVQVVGGIPQISRSCSRGDTSFIRRYVDNFF